MTVLKFVVTLGTLPYYRTFQFNTLQPIRLIAFYSSQPEHYEKFLYHLDSWRTRKLAESQYISVAVSQVFSSDPEHFSSIELNPFTVRDSSCCCNRLILLEYYSRRPLADIRTLVFQSHSLSYWNNPVSATGSSATNTWATSDSSQRSL